MKKTDTQSVFAKRALFAFLALMLAAACAIANAGCGGEAPVDEAAEAELPADSGTRADSAESPQPAASQAQPSVEQESGASVKGKSSASSGLSEGANSGNASKPSANTGGSASGSSGNTASSPSASQHSHSWTPVTVHHDAVYEQQWVENVVQKHGYICGTCKHISASYSEASAHVEASGRGGCGSFGSYSWTEDHGSYQSVCVQEAYDEIVGYKCSCGATK